VGIGPARDRCVRVPALPRANRFRINALISLHANAGWGKLAAEFLEAKNDPATLKPFVNTILGQPWREDGADIDADPVQERAEDFSLENIPTEVLYATAGVDVHKDRLVAVILG
jgi:phage terminase large subunit GpA-like protein